MAVYGKRCKERFQLLIVRGGIEPDFVGEEATSWEELEAELLRLLKSDDYDEAEDTVCYLRLTPRGCLKRGCGTFSGGYMDEMRAKADAEASRHEA